MKKTCIHCKTEKPLTEFYKRKDKKDGLQSLCKLCDNERKKIASRSPAYREKAKRWKEKNLDKVRQYSRIWAANNKEASGRWGKSHPEYRVAMDKKYRGALADRYIKTLLLSGKCAPAQLIEAKRLHIQIMRKLKELKA